jgi:hypothetical protein
MGLLLVDGLWLMGSHILDFTGFEFVDFHSVGL